MMDRILTRDYREALAAHDGAIAHILRKLRQTDELTRYAVALESHLKRRKAIAGLLARRKALAAGKVVELAAWRDAP